MRLLVLVIGFVLVQAGQPAAFRVEVSGHGPAMILIPGMSSSGDTWKSTVAHYQERYTCHVLTLAGFAGVPATGARPVLGTVEEALAGYIESHHLDKPIVVGHSLGGTLALDLASRHPDLVGPLVIVDSLPFYAAAWFQVKTADEAKPMIASMKGYMTAQTREQYEAYVRSGAATKFMATDPAQLATITDWGLHSDQSTVTDVMVEMLGMDLRSGLQRITSPTLLVGTWVGLHDQLEQAHISLTREQVANTFKEQFAGLSRLHFELSDNSRHFVMFDQPEWLFARMDAFLASPSRVTSERGFLQ